MRKGLRLVEIAAWACGLLCLLALLLFRVEALQSARAASRLQSPPAQAQGSEEHREANRDFATFRGVIGRLEIPALRLQVPILNDYDPNSLRQGVGRIQGTGVPGGLGNFVVAGHRDTYFRPLRNVQKGMVMHVVADNGTFDYTIDRTEIVTPEDVEVLDIGDRPEMTLITCYPFDFVGAAPKRFIVHGHLNSVATQ